MGHMVWGDFYKSWKGTIYVSQILFKINLLLRHLGFLFFCVDPRYDVIIFISWDPKNPKILIYLKRWKDWTVTFLVRLNSRLTPVGKSTIQWSVWFWRFPKALLLKFKIIDISTRDVKFDQLSNGITILMIWISYQGLIYRKLEGVQLFSERIII